MPLGGPGPRDWSPTPANPPALAPRTPTWSAPSTPQGGGWALPKRRSSVGGLATISFLTGVLALAVMVLQPANDQTTHGFFVSTIGVTAVVTGVQALKRGRYGKAVPRLLARTGVVLGGLGSAAVAWTLIAFLLLPFGVVLPALPTSLSTWLPTSGASLFATAPLGVDQAPIADPGMAVLPAQPLAPVTASEEQLELGAAVGTLAHVLAETRPVGSPWPDHLLVTTSAGPIGVSSPEGIALVTVPAGTQILYSVSPDRSVFAVDLVGGTFGSEVHYDSSSGAVTSG